MSFDSELPKNIEQGINNIEYALYSTPSSFLVPCSLFNICFDSELQKNIEQGTRNREYIL